MCVFVCDKKAVRETAERILRSCSILSAECHLGQAEYQGPCASCPYIPRTFIIDVAH